MNESYRNLSCKKCGGFGTIVALGKCCLVAAFVASDEIDPTRFDPLYYSFGGSQKNYRRLQDGEIRSSDGLAASKVES